MSVFIQCQISRMMRKQNKGSDFLPVQTRKNSELSIILTSLIFHCELAMINFCPPRSSTGKWVVLRRKLGGNAVDEKSVAVGIGVGYRWAKKSTPPVRGVLNKNSAEGVIAPAGAKVTGATIRMWLLNKFISFLAVLTWKTGLKKM